VVWWHEKSERDQRHQEPVGRRATGACDDYGCDRECNCECECECD
jgi:hypothetical protein